MASTRESIVFGGSEAFKDALATRAQAEDISASELIRKAVAAYIGYDLDAEPKTERPRKYADKAARDKAMRERAKAKRQNTAALMAAIKEGKNEADILAIARSLAGRGVSETADKIVEDQQ